MAGGGGTFARCLHVLLGTYSLRCLEATWKGSRDRTHPTDGEAEARRQSTLSQSQMTEPMSLCSTLPRSQVPLSQGPGARLFLLETERPMNDPPAPAPSPPSSPLRNHQSPQQGKPQARYAWDVSNQPDVWHVTFRVLTLWVVSEGPRREWPAGLGHSCSPAKGQVWVLKPHMDSVGLWGHADSSAPSGPGWGGGAQLFQAHHPGQPLRACGC